MYRVILVVMILVMGIEGIMVRVEPRTSECFYIDFRIGEMLHVDHIITSGGIYDIEIRVTSPSGLELFRQVSIFPDGSDKDSRIFIAQENGRYEVCFDNHMSRWTSKVVEFYYGKEASAGKGVNTKNMLKKDHLGRTEADIGEIASQLMEVRNMQRSFFHREQSARETQESAQSWVYYGALLETMLLVAVTAAKIMFIRRLFKTRKSFV